MANENKTSEDKKEENSEQPVIKKSIHFKEDEDVDETISRKKPRKRKKSLYKAIVDQMNFYLGDANCSRSKFMKELTDKSPWIDIEIFLKFNKLTAILFESFGQAETTDDLWSALKAIPSEVFEIREVSENGSSCRQIKRKNPLIMYNEQGNDSKTIYVERIPPNVDIDTLRHVFQKYGPVQYVSLPKYKHNGTPKGFAFLEFETEKGANDALEGFISIKRRISSALDPGELQSVKSFHIEQDVLQKETDGTSKSLPTTIPIGTNKSESGAIKNEGRETESETKDQNSEKGSVEIKDEDIDKGEGVGKNDEKKSKRKRKRKNHDQDSSRNNNSGAGDLLSVLQIMPRTEWKRLRNKYLNLQRKNMAHSKMRLKQFHDRQKNKRFSNHEEKADYYDQDEEDHEAGKPKIEFTTGIIVKFEVNDPIEDEKKVKQRIKAAIMEPVNYVDVKIGATEYHVRCAHPEMAKTLSNAKILGQSTILEGEEETAYWEKIKQDREAKLSGKVKTKNNSKKMRGQDRLVKKIQSMNQNENSHKFFDD